MGTTSSKSTLLKHQQSQENLDSGTPERYYHRRSPSNTTTSSSQRSLATKFHQKSNSSKLLEVEPGRMSPSGSSCGSKTKGILGKIKKKKRSRSSSYLYDDNMAASVSSVGSLQTCSTLDDESTIMGATEAATSLLLARYDHEKDAFLSQTASCAPCIVSQTPELRLSALKLDCSDITPQASTGHSCDTAYTTTSTTTTVPVVPFDANMYRIDCERYTKEWLATPKYSGIHKGLSSQEVVMDLFLQPNNEADRRKEKDRQQRLVRKKSCTEVPTFKLIKNTNYK
jgi:hypothetical protein